MWPAVYPYGNRCGLDDDFQSIFAGPDATYRIRRRTRGRLVASKGRPGSRSVCVARSPDLRASRVRAGRICASRDLAPARAGLGIRQSPCATWRTDCLDAPRVASAVLSSCADSRAGGIRLSGTWRSPRVSRRLTSLGVAARGHSTYCHRAVLYLHARAWTPGSSGIRGLHARVSHVRSAALRDPSWPRAYAPRPVSTPVSPRSSLRDARPAFWRVLAVVGHPVPDEVMVAAF